MIDIAMQKLVAQVANVSGRVTPSSETAPASKALPRVVYTLIDDPPQYTDDGRCGLRKAQFQLDIFADKYSQARSVQMQIMRPASATPPGLDGFRGTIANTAIQRIYFGSPHTGNGTNTPGQDQTIARATVDVLIDYRELLEQPNFATT